MSAFSCQTDPVNTTKILKNIAKLETKQATHWNPQRESLLRRLKEQLAYRLDYTPTNDQVKDLSGKFCLHARTSSAAERHFFDRAKKSGWVVSKRGWPDFFMWKNGKIALVEVKLENQKPRENQEAVLSALASYGIPCYVWRPKTGFVRVRSGDVKGKVLKAIHTPA